MFGTQEVWEWQWKGCVWLACVDVLLFLLSCTSLLLLQDNTANDPGSELHCPQDTGHQGRTESTQGAGFLRPCQTPSQDNSAVPAGSGLWKTPKPDAVGLELHEWLSEDGCVCALPARDYCMCLYLPLIKKAEYIITKITSVVQHLPCVWGRHSGCMLQDT